MLKARFAAPSLCCFGLLAPIPLAVEESCYGENGSEGYEHTEDGGDNECALRYNEVTTVELDADIRAV
jgi:hypothetical protein